MKITCVPSTVEILEVFDEAIEAASLNESAPPLAKKDYLKLSKMKAEEVLLNIEDGLCLLETQLGIQLSVIIKNVLFEITIKQKGKKPIFLSVMYDPRFFWSTEKSKEFFYFAFQEDFISKKTFNNQITLKNKRRKFLSKL